MGILTTELSQLKRIAIINAISNCVCKGCFYRCYILKFNTLANRFEQVLSDSKIDKKRYPFPSCRHKSQWKKGYPFPSFANKCNRSLMLPLFRLCRGIFIYRKAFINQFSIF